MNNRLMELFFANQGMEREKMKIKSFDALNDACKKNELDRFNEYSHEQKVTFLKTNGIHLGREYGGTYIEKRNQFC